MGLLETAAASLAGGEQRLNTLARNISNASTPGYKREVAYSEVADLGLNQSSSLIAPEVRTASLMSQGVLVETGNPLDIAINGSGLLLLRDGGRFTLSRGGRFAPGPHGTLIDALGRALQNIGGGDLWVSGGALEILPDGTVLEDGAPVGAISLYEPSGILPGTKFGDDQLAMLAEAEGSELLQGMTEKSNVVLSDEMVGLMQNQRQVESSAQLVRAYDQLMSQAISTFSRSS